MDLFDHRIAEDLRQTIADPIADRVLVYAAELHRLDVLLAEVAVDMERACPAYQPVNAI